MADFYPVLKRAIGALPSNTGEARRAVYERARSALVRQLQAYDPPLSPAQITDQRLALEESIRRVESELAGVAFGLAPETPAPPPPPPPKAAEPPPKPAPAKAEPPRVEPPPVAAPVKSEPAASEPVKPEPAAAEADGGKSPLSRAREESLQLGGATAAAIRAMRDKLDETSEPVPGTPERVEPKLGAERREPVPVAANEPEPPKPESLSKAEKRRRAAEARTEPTLGDASAPAPTPDGDEAATADIAAERSASKPPREKTAREPAPRDGVARDGGRGRRIAIFAVLALLVAGAIGAVAGMQAGVVPDVLGIARPGDTATPPPEGTPAAEAPPPANGDGLEPKIDDRLPQEGMAAPVAPDARPVQTLRVTPPPEDEEAAPAAGAEPDAPPPEVVPPEATTPAPDTAAPGTAAPATTPPEAAPPAAEAPATGAPAAEQPEAAAPAPGGDTVAQATPPAAAPEATPRTDGGQPAVIVAQRSILYEEPVAGSEGTRLEGEAIWSFTDSPPAGGGAAEPAIRAEVSIPERGLRLVMTIRQNRDDALPASHLVDLSFAVEPSFTGRSIAATPGLILKQTEDARGDPLVGAVAPVSENLFWVALSSTERDLERNIALLKEREWIDVPIRYGDRRRAILTFEKGTPGRRAFDQALAAWGQ